MLPRPGPQNLNDSSSIQFAIDRGFHELTGFGRVVTEPLLGDGGLQRLHDKIKAPENHPRSVAYRARQDPTSPVTVYTTPELTPDGNEVTAGTIILRTKGCHWWWSSGCTFCGYFNDTREDAGAEELEIQWARALETLSHHELGMLKVYTSGSLFEEREIPLSFQKTVLQTASELDIHLIVESRTEQLTDDKLKWAASIHSNLTIAIGLEAHDDEVLQFHINKGFSVNSWKDACVRIRAHGLRSKTYLMLKPPFMSEADGLDTCIEWARACLPMSDDISINPMNIQRGTTIDRRCRSGEYRPPWLWSIVALIEAVHDEILSSSSFTRLIVHPTGAGSVRGAHNCGKCDAGLTEAIERYAIDRDLDDLLSMDCECRVAWEEQIRLERILPVPLGINLSRRGPVERRIVLSG